MKNAVEIIEALRYKTRMSRVLIGGSMNIFCDNGAVCVNTTRPKLALSKKHHGISWHFTQEAVVEGTVRVSKENTSTKLAELFTKMMAEPNREGLLENLHIERQIGVCGFSTLLRFTTSNWPTCIRNNQTRVLECTFVVSYRKNQSNIVDTG